VQFVQQATRLSFRKKFKAALENSAAIRVSSKIVYIPTETLNKSQGIWVNPLQDLLDNLVWRKGSQGQRKCRSIIYVMILT